MARYLPPEWAPQERVLFSFPRRDGDWGQLVADACGEMMFAIEAVARVCPVTVVVSDRENYRRSLLALQRAYGGEYSIAELTANFNHVELPTDDAWIRDFGPITVLTERGRQRLLNFRFNGWGGKFPAGNDNAVNRGLAGNIFLNKSFDTLPIVLEGGSIETDGRGTLLTTSRCLLAPHRNDWPDKAAAEAELGPLLGTDRFLWLDHGQLAGDDTDAHIDTLARFTDPRTIAYVRCDDPADEHYGEFQRMEEQLRGFRTPEGQPYRLLPLPWAPAIHHPDDGHRLPASYANFLISNGYLFLPQYFMEEPDDDHPGRVADRRAQEVLREATEYTVIPLSCRAFISQHGALHCLTMQIPAARSVSSP